MAVTVVRVLVWPCAALLAHWCSATLETSTTTSAVLGGVVVGAWLLVEFLYAPFVYIFLDNSNIYHSLQHSYPGRRIQFDGLEDLACRRHDLPRPLCRWLSRTPSDERYIAGSIPPPNDALWEHAKRAGFKTMLLERSRQNKETGVDDVLQGKMLFLERSLAGRLLSFLGVTGRPVVALFSGDGNDNEGRGGFPAACKTLRQRGFEVEVFAFRSSLSQHLKRQADRVVVLDDELAVFTKTVDRSPSHRPSRGANRASSPSQPNRDAPSKGQSKDSSPGRVKDSSPRPTRTSNTSEHAARSSNKGGNTK